MWPSPMDIIRLVSSIIMVVLSLPSVVVVGVDWHLSHGSMMYHQVPVRVPPTLTVGAPLPVNNFSDLIREEVARAGYVEMLTHGLCSRADNFTSLRRPEGPAVALLNPANIEYEIVRTSLLPGLLKCLQYNRVVGVKDGLKLFEISDVVLKDTETTDVGARNVRRLVASYTGLTSGFEVREGRG